VHDASGVLDADGPHKYQNPRLVSEGMGCELPRLPEISLPGTQAAVAPEAAPAA
jgi:hypothetical protein